MDKDIQFEITLHRENNKYFGILTSDDSDFGVLKTTGSILISNNFDKVWIQLDEINSRYNITGYISGPAGNIKEANEIARSFLENTQ